MSVVRPSSNNGGRRIALLLVEDNEADANLVGEFLDDAALGRYELRNVSRLADALSSLRETDPDALLLDLGLPDMQGIDAVTAIRTQSPDVPIVVLTGNRNEELAVNCLANGANDYVMKDDMAPDLLRRSIDYAIARQSLARLRERERREEIDRLDQMRRAAESLVEANPDAVLVVDRTGTTRYANIAAERLFGTTRAALVGQPFAFPVERGTVREVEIPRADDPIFAEVHANEIEWEGASMFLVAVRDLTDRRAIEEQLRHSQKTETLGRLIGGVAHDFNNLLTVIQGGSELLAEKLPAGSAERRFADSILQAARRGADLTGKLLSVSRRSRLDPEPVDVATAVDELASLLHRTLGDDIELAIGGDPSLPLAMIDRSQFEAALLNLVVNARDAMPGGGRLSIESSLETLDPDYAMHHVEVTPGSYVTVSVTDTGVGMSPDVLQNAFEAFYTTKDVGRGTGLGLAMVQGFVKQSGGHVSLYSELGHGTTVRLFLPLADTEAVTQSADAEAVAPGGNESVLVVEDQELVRRYVVGVLSGLGYTVHEASQASEALVLLDEGIPVDVLFTDIVMPGGMGGYELAVAATKSRPGLRVLFSSGYTEHAIARAERNGSRVKFLAKPYGTRTLAVRLREALDDEPFEPLDDL